MRPAVRIRVIVGVAAVVAAGAVTGIVLATRQDPPQPKTECPQGAKALIVPGVPATNAAAVERAMSLSPHKAVLLLEPLASNAPKDPLVQYNYGVALFCAGYLAEATTALESAKSSGANTYYRMRADELLHPQYFTPTDGLYPVFEPTGTDPLLLRGVLLQREGHEVSAERVYEQAAKLHPNDAEAQVAAAVGRFDEDNLNASFSRLGPLVERFPRSQSVRYHLGLLLAWTGQRAQAIVEFRRARALGPATKLGREANTFLNGLVAGGTSSTTR